MSRTHARYEASHGYALAAALSRGVAVLELRVASGDDGEPLAAREAARAGAQRWVTAGATRRVDAPDGAFDVVVCLRTLDAVPAPAALLAEILRVLRIDGILIATVANGERGDAMAELLRTAFPDVRIAGQSLIAASVVVPLAEPSTALSVRGALPREPDVLLVVCGTELGARANAVHEVYVESGEDMLDELRTDTASTELAAVTGRLHAAEQRLALFELERLNAEDRAAAAEAVLRSVVESRTWRMTAPIRRVMAVLRSRR